MSLESRIKILTVGYFLFFLLIAGRLFFWQVARGGDLAAAAESQHFATLEISASRGEILASDKTPWVGNQTAYLLFADIRKLKDPVATIEQKIGTISGNLSDPNAVWVPLEDRVTEAEKDRVMGFGFAGIDYSKESVRYYPEASSAAQIMGFVGQDQNGAPQGYFGLEGYYNRELSGHSGYKRLERDAFGRPIALSPETEVAAQDGSTLLTSIDKTVQFFSEKELAKGVETWGAAGGTVIVMDPNTGHVLAMASQPSYDPRTYQDFQDVLFKNPAVADTYEPGSIMKPLIMGAALNEHKLTPATRCPVCSGPRAIEGGTIRTFDNVYHPNLTMTEVLVNSDNTGMVFVGESLGKDLLLKYLNKYQFGQKTGIDLQEEEAGRVKTEWYPLDLATVTFGQGIAVTPIQMVRGFAAIANGGFMVTPEVATKIGNFEVKPKIGDRVLSKATTDELKEMLVKVNQESPLHFPMDRIPGLSRYRIAAKSGTAQIPVGGSYTENKTIASVIGFAPADNPRFVVYVKLNEPQIRIWGSDTAGPVFYSLLNDLLLYYNISP